MAVTTDTIAIEQETETSIFARLGQFFDAFRAAQVVAATYEQNHDVRGKERAIFDRAFSRI